ncbi:hypothetical protein TIFTF001_008208 [Ficus carica]|uniref:Uncharacterized protein n=1 Tax=Ficus carica TaxID=3494 RepID=A0AA88D0C6_FICCA|nr:hypothetical protein TIFTF001_008208 [Ficus carica]
MSADMWGGAMEDTSHGLWLCRGLGVSGKCRHFGSLFSMKSRELIGLGVLARDENGMVLGAVARRMLLGLSLLTLVNAWPSKRVYGSLGFSSWILETDALNVVHSIDDPAHRSVEANVIDDIRDVLFSHKGCVFVKANLLSRI